MMMDKIEEKINKKDKNKKIAIKKRTKLNTKNK
jgi:hypothetical protein